LRNVRHGTYFTVRPFVCNVCLSVMLIFGGIRQIETKGATIMSFGDEQTRIPSDPSKQRTKQKDPQKDPQKGRQQENEYQF